MIEVKARILQRCVFIAGERMECEVMVTNHDGNRSSNNNKNENNTKGSEESDTSLNRCVSELQLEDGIKRCSSDSRLYDKDILRTNNSVDIKKKDTLRTNGDDSVTLAWASAQIYCHCNINERQLKLPVNLQNHIKAEHINKYTSYSPVMGEKGHCLCSTPATVLFCNIKLKKGESKKFIYNEELPVDFPPSYKGQNVKFSYKVCIAIGRIGHPLCMIRLPFRLYEVKGIFKSLNEKREKQAIIESNRDPQQLCESINNDIEYAKPKNPFLKESVGEKYSTLDAAMEALTGFTVKKNMNTYNIQSVNGAVGKFCLSKYYYRLGEDVLGTFDFSEGPISCIKYTVSLQIEETVSKNCLLQPSISNLVQYMTMSCYEECCCLATKTHFLLPIPVTACSEFTHKIVSIRWRLHFEFIIDTTETVGDENTDEDSAEKTANLEIPSRFKTESMLWDLPIHVVATNPIQASLMMQADSTEVIQLPDT